VKTKRKGEYKTGMPWNLTDLESFQGGKSYLLQVILDENDVMWLEEALREAVKDLSSERNKRERLACVLEEPLKVLQSRTQVERNPKGYTIKNTTITKLETSPWTATNIEEIRDKINQIIDELNME
jgi:hypothetical protein